MTRVAELTERIESSPVIRRNAELTDAEPILKFVVLSAIHLLVGTVQGAGLGIFFRGHLAWPVFSG